MRRVFFLHIEKCAGTSLRDGITRVVRPHAPHPSAITYMDGNYIYRTREMDED